MIAVRIIAALLLMSSITGRAQPPADPAAEAASDDQLPGERSDPEADADSARNDSTAVSNEIDPAFVEVDPEQDATAAVAGDTTPASAEVDSVNSAFRPVVTARQTFQVCLYSFVTRAIIANMGRAQFDGGFPQVCLAQEAAFRESLIARALARSSPADAEEAASMEIDDTRANSRDPFDMARPSPR